MILRVTCILQIQRWFRQRKQAELPSTLQKFCETGWRFVFYTVIFVYGLAVLWTKHWFWDIEGCWVDYPKHKVKIIKILDVFSRMLFIGRSLLMFGCTTCLSCPSTGLYASVSSSMFKGRTSGRCSSTTRPPSP